MACSSRRSLGADVVEIASVLYRLGIDQLAALLDGVAYWMESNDFNSVGENEGHFEPKALPGRGGVRAPTTPRPYARSLAISFDLDGDLKKSRRRAQNNPAIVPSTRRLAACSRFAARDSGRSVSRPCESRLAPRIPYCMQRSQTGIQRMALLVKQKSRYTSIGPDELNYIRRELTLICRIKASTFDRTLVLLAANYDPPVSV